MSESPLHSTGRGGAGNIGHDPNVYADAGIVREGVQGQGDGEFSTGRGGAGNITKSPLIRPNLAEGSPRGSEEFIPEQSLRQPQENFHTGRGGQGNVYKEKYGGHSHSPERKGLGDKVKHALGIDKDKKPEQPSPLHNEAKD